MGGRGDRENIFVDYIFVDLKTCSFLTLDLYCVHNFFFKLKVKSPCFVNALYCTAFVIWCLNYPPAIIIEI